MLDFILFLSLLLFLFLLSHFLKQRLFIFFYLTTKNQKLTVSLLSLLLFPGVVIHELSHLIMAVVLFVRVKSMTLVPKVIEGRIQGGSVTIQKVDVFRRTLVGIAPLFGGITVVYLISTYLLPPIFRSTISKSFSFIFNNETMKQLNNDSFFLALTPNSQLLITIFSLYLLFSISASMYSSCKDLEALLYVIPIILFGGVLLYIFGFQVSSLVPIINTFSELFLMLSTVLVVPLILHCIVLLALFLLRKMY